MREKTTRYEYKCEGAKWTEAAQALNKASEDGWDLVHTDIDDEGFWAFLLRRRKD